MISRLRQRAYLCWIQIGPGADMRFASVDTLQAVLQQRTRRRAAGLEPTYR
jgi:hypothetical protein